MRHAVILLAFIALGPACRGAAGTSPGGTSTGLQLNLAVYPVGIYPGEQTLIVMTLINRNSRPVLLRYDTSCHVVYYIENPAGTVVVPNTGTWSCSPSVSQVQLAAHQTSVTSVPFTGESIGTNGTKVPFPPGDYAVRAEYAPNPDIASPRVTLTIH